MEAEIDWEIINTPLPDNEDELLLRVADESVSPAIPPELPPHPHNATKLLLEATHMHPNNHPEKDEYVTRCCDATWFEEEIYTSEDNKGPPPLMDNDGDSSSDESVDSVVRDNGSTTSKDDLLGSE